MNDFSPHLSRTSAGLEPSTIENLNRYRRIVLLTDGYSTPFLGKTAISLLRYRPDDIVGVLDQGEVGKMAPQLFGTGDGIPVVATVDNLDADALFVGIAPPGGKLPGQWRSIIIDALQRGIDVVSGLHDFLSLDVEFTNVAKKYGSKLIDVRQNNERETAQRVTFREGCTRIQTVGQDCSVGKMVAALEVQRALIQRDIDSRFVATGQTGIMISGAGVPIDCVVSDFVNGAAERLVQRNEHHEVLLIEGQGSISHPRFSAVTLGLLHGCAPNGLIYCYEVGRTMVKGLDNVPLWPHDKMMKSYEINAALRHPSRIIGIAMNSRNVSASEAADERVRMTDEFGLPVCDVYRDGPSELADAILNLRKELQR